MPREKGLVRKETGEIEPLEPWNTFKEMERMFRDFFVSPMTLMRPPRWWLREGREEFVPEVDLRETDKEFVLSASVPGMARDDIDIDVTKDSITICGERKTEAEQPGERYHFRQQSYGSFSACYSLPSEVKPRGVKAVYKNGVLEVTMPKAEVTEAHKVKVEIKE